MSLVLRGSGVSAAAPGRTSLNLALKFTKSVETNFSLQQILSEMIPRPFEATQKNQFG